MANRPKIFYSYFVPATGCALLILVLCLMSPRYIPDVEFNLLSPDKIAHFLLFGMLLHLSVWGLIKNRLFNHKNILLLAVLTVAYGAIIELLQMMMHNGRSADLEDIAANAIGALMVYLFYIAFYRSLSKKIARAAETP